MLEYAFEPYEAYTREYGGGRAQGRAFVVGMNPGPWGMVSSLAVMRYVSRELGRGLQRVHDAGGEGARELYRPRRRPRFEKMASKKRFKFFWGISNPSLTTHSETHPRFGDEVL